MYAYNVRSYRRIQPFLLFSMRHCYDYDTLLCVSIVVAICDGCDLNVRSVDVRDFR